MLVSHLKKFIYLKAPKSASTSVELYFERFCKPPGDTERETEARFASVTTAGIVGYRGPDRGGQVWYGHMPAATIRALLGPKTWDDYRKFCVVRNPFDRLVSYWWYKQPADGRGALALADFSEIRATFSQWVSSSQVLPNDRRVYWIDGRPCIDFFIRYERLIEDLSEACVTLDVPFEPARLGRFKSRQRVRTEPFWLYYDPAAEERVDRLFAFELEQYGYRNGPQALATESG